mmetsp:Transcript_38639/g.127906  ORF Transcript_38639/g.127906 Transcript_38639/m.127906 type:complete len:296 (-) Transcript_38639:240-1127(-)
MPRARAHEHTLPSPRPDVARVTALLLRRPRPRRSRALRGAASGHVHRGWQRLHRHRTAVDVALVAPAGERRQHHVAPLPLWRLRGLRHPPQRLAPDLRQPRLPARPRRPHLDVHLPHLDGHRRLHRHRRPRRVVARAAAHVDAPPDGLPAHLLGRAHPQRPARRRRHPARRRSGVWDGRRRRRRAAAADADAQATPLGPTAARHRPAQAAQHRLAAALRRACGGAGAAGVPSPHCARRTEPLRGRLSNTERLRPRVPAAVGPKHACAAQPLGSLSCRLTPSLTLSSSQPTAAACV